MEKVTFSLSVAAIGILVVFVGLIILIFAIQLLSKLSTAGTKKEKKAAQPAPAAAPVAAPIVATPAAPVAEGIPAEVIAAITAAIAAVWDGAQGGFTVKHVRRISNAPIWSRAGREEQTYSRF